MRWQSVPNPWSLASCPPLQPLVLSSSVFIWILNIQDKTQRLLLSENTETGRNLSGYQLKAVVIIPPSVQLRHLDTLTAKIRT